MKFRGGKMREIKFRAFEKMMCRGDAITIPTSHGANDVYLGDSVFMKDGICYVERC